MRKLVDFAFRIMLLGFMLSMVYFFFPPHMEITEALRLGFFAAILITGILLLIDYGIFFIRKSWRSER
ncbi:hypothetical protein Marky_2129 [Marinithermus hydrothermalis DSM 14884]|uniref:Uncharacterized protein n=1 Tax=Marinithermus hydrothermalis (strain DSM 14884 / JCM 11576 / T1) TaxID=869210 RepID=F2NPS6_MARHT|nr:hypothetical protein Marky_2129 [Marinithermus hydrothermalis DSM 14884]